LKIEVKVGDIADWRDEAVVVNLFKGVKRPGGATGALDKATGRAISKLIESGDFQGRFKDVAVLPATGELPAKRIIIVGLGEKDKFTIDRIREASGKAALQARETGLKSFSTIVHGAGIGRFNLDEATEAMAEGALLALYRYTRYKTDDEWKKDPEVMTIVTTEKARVGVMQRAVESGIIVASAGNMVRDLVNMPSNDKPPQRLAEFASKVARDSGFKCKVLDERQMADIGMGGVMAVGKGSEEPPRFLVLEYKGARRGKPIVLVGKGITFDTGGISLKPQEGPLGPIWEMRHDMAGMATVLATISAATRLKLPLDIIALAPLAENMPSGHAQRPGDVLKMYGGKTVEVLSTDAEGRLILADALVYAEKLKPQAIVDVATLTGTAVYALGKRVTPVMGNDSRLIRRLERAGVETGERVWELPMFDEYAEQIKSDLADLKNTGGKSAGCITAGMFLRQFVGNTPWAHLDIAGTVWVHGGPESIDKAYMPKGPSGVPARLLIGMLRNWGRTN
jgi:leucyl aminopeptidase